MSKLIKNTTLYSIGRILPQVANFFLLPVYTRLLDTAEFGIVGSMQALTAILMFAFTLALDRSIFRLYWDYKTEKERRDFLGTLALGLICLSSLFLAALFIFHNQVALIYKSITFYPYYAYAIVSSFLFIFSLIPTTYFQLKEKAGAFILITTAQFFTNVGIILWFVVHKRLGAEGMLLGQMLGNACFVPIYLFIVWRIANFTIRFDALKSALRFSLPMIPALLSAWILNLSDRIFIERYFDLSEVGVYSLAFRISSVGLIITGSFVAAYNPVFFRLASSEDQSLAKKTLTKYNNLFAIVIVGVFFLIALFAGEAIELLLAPEFIEARNVVPILALAYCIASCGDLGNLTMYQEKKTPAVMFIQIAGAIVKIALSFLIIPKYGIYGAAWTTVAAFALTATTKYWYSRKCYFISYHWRRLTPLAVGAFAIFLLFWFININIYYFLTIKIAFVSAVLLIFAFCYRSTLREFLSFKNKRASL